MSFFGKLFGGKKEEAPSTSDAIQKLRETQDLLSKKQEYLEKQIDDCLLVARKNASKNKRGEFNALKMITFMITEYFLYWYVNCRLMQI